jgi:hypothetical protein
VALAPRESKKSAKDEGLPAEFKELIDLVVTYAKQETIGPLKDLKRYVGFGLLGAVAWGLGLFFLGLGLLRAIQTEAGRHLAGDWSWAPYLCVVVFYGVVIAILVGRMSHGPGQDNDRSKER